MAFENIRGSEANDNVPPTPGDIWMQNFDSARDRLEQVYKADLSHDDLSQLYEDLEQADPKTPAEDIRARRDDVFGRFFNRATAYDAQEYLRSKGYFFHAGILAAKLKDRGRVYSCLRTLSDLANSKIALGAKERVMTAVVMANAARELGIPEHRYTLENALQRADKEEWPDVKVLAIIALNDAKLAQQAMTRMWQELATTAEDIPDALIPALALAWNFPQLRLSLSVIAKGEATQLLGRGERFIHAGLNPETYISKDWIPEKPEPFGPSEWYKRQVYIKQAIEMQRNREETSRETANLTAPTIARDVFYNASLLAGAWEKPKEEGTAK